MSSSCVECKLFEIRGSIFYCGDPIDVAIWAAWPLDHILIPVAGVSTASIVVTTPWKCASALKRLHPILAVPATLIPTDISNNGGYLSRYVKLSKYLLLADFIPGLVQVRVCSIMITLSTTFPECPIITSRDGNCRGLLITKVPVQVPILA